MEGPAGPRNRRQGAQHAGYVVSFLGSVVRAMFMPSGYVVASCPLVIAALMAWAFLLGGRESPFSVPAYLVSGWALLVTSIWVARCPAKAGLRILCERSRFFGRLVTDPDYRLHASTAVGFALYLAWGAFNLASSIFFASTWLLVLGAYFLLFGGMRALLFLQLLSGSYTIEKGCRIERVCGALLIASVLVLSGIVTHVMAGSGAYRYDGDLIYMMALFVFYSLISSIVSYTKLRRKDPVIATIRRINLSVALVALFALETAMLSTYGTTPADEQLSFVMPIITGTVIAVVIAVLGIRSIITASLRLKTERMKCAPNAAMGRGGRCIDSIHSAEQDCGFIY